MPRLSVNFEELKTSAATDQVAKVMRSNRKVDTRPELELRRSLWSEGLRGFRKNYKGLPGCPDVVYTRRRLIIDVRGCFWHDCPTCRAGKVVTKNAAYWNVKIARNVERDAENELAWTELGYHAVVIWEHEVRKDAAAAVDRVRAALLSSPAK